MPLNLQALSGDWYEMGRVPKTDVMKCLVVSVPQKADENLELHLEYISTLGGDIQRVRETVQFPMDNFTKNSIFHLFYSGSLSIIITYKVIYTDYKHMTLICGYAGISPVPLIKLLSRQRQLDQRSIDFIQAQLLSGIWYEAGRVPNEDVMNCLNVSVPATVDEQLDLRLEYLSRINGKDQVVKETITFPWDNNTQNGIFNLDYNGPSASMSVTYKIVYTIPKVVTFICGYASISPIPLLKIFSRERQISQQTIEMVNSFLTAAGYADDIIWTDQSFARCNAAVSGYWYEVARVPNMDILKCLNVSVPAAVDKDLELQLEYISSINGETYAKRETVTFPWDDKTRNSTFSLEYVISGNINVSVTYKIIYTDYTNVTFLCGYSGISPIPLFKLLSRQRQLSPTYIDFIKTLAEKAGISRQIIWTEQSPDQCNDAVRPTTGTLAILAISILWMFTKI
ncbi:GH18206 [Drosophila grimshawi]|uniref:GH18206 n=1 Tax=Drosophila grimshawi TaxID=7222 RepID=B4JFU2_DROGR|nr:GH18206 [Drosophila grimshawi]